MADRPILFSSEMVRAILDERKTETRRTMKPQPVLGVSETMFKDNLNIALTKGMINRPFGLRWQVGDRLWVRETWAPTLDSIESHAYRATDALPQGVSRWHPSIFMPRRASRLTLEVTAIRAERLQDIIEEDAKAEGFKSVAEFRIYWDILNAKRGHGWDKNDWVWVISFKAVE